jgi:hypothetical protein
MTRKKTLIALTIVIIGLAIACSKETASSGGGGGTNPPGTPSTEDPCEGISAQFAQNIAPIIQTKCATNSGCHGTGSINGPGALTSFQQIKDNASRIQNAVNSGRMPLNGSLTTTQLKQINCWVNSGAQNN